MAEVLQFQLFRIQVFFPPQPRLPTLGDDERDPATVLRGAIESRPERESKPGVRWHIGNVEPLGTDGMYFALGRTTRATMELYDEQAGNFSEMKYRTAPYTHVVVDVPLEVCCIARKTKLAEKTSGIARQLELLLSASDVVAARRVRIEVGEIADPEGFLRRIRDAYAVTEFSMKFRLPNAWDAETDYIKPRQRAVEELHATRGRTQFSGDALNKEALEELTRSSAATGDDASATILEGKDKSSGVRIHLHGNNVLFRSEEPTSPERREQILDKMGKQYRRVRGSES